MNQTDLDKDIYLSGEHKDQKKTRIEIEVADCDKLTKDYSSIMDSYHTAFDRFVNENADHKLINPKNQREFALVKGLTRVGHEVYEEGYERTTDTIAGNGYMITHEISNTGDVIALHKSDNGNAEYISISRRKTHEGVVSHISMVYLCSGPLIPTFMESNSFEPQKTRGEKIGVFMGVDDVSSVTDPAWVRSRLANCAGKMGLNMQSPSAPLN